jgi:hypothetical protein
VDLEHLLVSLYVLVDEWWQETHPPTPKKAGRPPSLCQRGPNLGGAGTMAEVA